jgi:hypothetical protein
MMNQRPAITFLAGLLVLGAAFALLPTERGTWSNRTLAQEPSAQEPNTTKGKSEPDPFQDRKATRQASTTQPALNAAGNPAKPNEARTNNRIHGYLAIESKLSQPMNHGYHDITLQDLVDVLPGTLGVPFLLDKKSLEDEGVGTGTTINFHLSSFPTDKFLDLMTRELDLAWVVRDDIVFITTQTALETLLEVRVYNCSDLIEMIPEPKRPFEGGFSGGFGEGFQAPGVGPAPPGRPAGPGGFFAVPQEAAAAENPAALASQTGGTDPRRGNPRESAKLVPDTDSLINLIQVTLLPETWAGTGGYASIESYHGGLLVINHHGQAHRRIEVLLNMMREAKQAPPGTVVRER